MNMILFNKFGTSKIKKREAVLKPILSLIFLILYNINSYIGIFILTILDLIKSI